jgi:hypothetical protein
MNFSPMLLSPFFWVVVWSVDHDDEIRCCLLRVKEGQIWGFRLNPSNSASKDARAIGYFQGQGEKYFHPFITQTVLYNISDTSFAFLGGSG